jgi:flagellar biosynthesis GTPase FlhF
MSTALYDTAPHPTAAREGHPTAPSDRARQHFGHRDRPGGAPGDFAPRIYRGRSVEELIPRIVAELGEDAVVIRHHRGLTGGFAGFFQRPFVEIEARRGAPGIDLYDEDDAAPVLPDEAASTPSDDAACAPRGELEDSQAPPAPAAEEWDEPMQVWATNPFAAALAEAEAAVRAAEPAVPPNLDAALAEALAEAEDAEAPVEEIVPAPSALPAAPTYTAVAAEATAFPAEIEDAALRAAAEDTTPPGAPTAPPEYYATPPLAAEPPDAAPEAPDAAPSSRAREEREEIERTLLAVGMGEELVRELIEGATAHVLPLMPASTSLTQAVRTTLAQRIPACPPLPAGGGAIAVVGAGGSGKSACCAALAEAYREHGTLPATWVTIAPQPTRSAPEETALREGRAESLLLLDTPPVSSASPASIAALAELLAELAPDRVVLALPATLGATPAAQLLQALRPLNANALAVTHADETDQLGVAVQAACTFGLAPLYLLARAEQGGTDGGLRSWALSSIDPCQLVDKLLPLP